MPSAEPLKTPHFRLIAAIARHGQLGLAAAACSMTQPAASRMLAEIERRVGSPVATRHARGLSPTLIGERLARRAEAMLMELDDIAREIAELKQGRLGTASVGAVTGGALGYVVPAIEALKAEAPHAAIAVEVAPSDSLARDLIAGRLDFILARLPPGFDPAEFDGTQGRGEELRLLVKEGHPEASRRRIRLAGIAAYPWVVQPRGTPIRAALEAAFLREGAPIPGDVTDTASLLVTIAMVARSNAITPVAAEVHRLLTESPVAARMTALNLAEPIFVQPYFLLVRRGRQLSPLAARLHRLVEERLSA